VDEELRYPIGRYEPTDRLTADERREAVAAIREAPARLRDAVTGLSDEQLDTPYREGGWTPRQVVHHVADSHLNGYVRMKWALTEETPTLKPYDQPSWAELPDSRAPVDLSLELLDALHTRWLLLIEALDEDDLARRLVHPEGGEPTVDSLLTLYAWHGRHHTAHITSLRRRKGW
jgi:uncharacterized damage-inducible protein DinB